MNLVRAFRIGSLVFVGGVFAGNFLPRSCVEQDVEESSFLDKEVAELNENFSYGVSGEDLVYLTRILYFEGAFDESATDIEEIQLGYIAIASVVKNRWEFDTMYESTKFAGDKGLRGVVEKEGQFSCVKDNYPYFMKKSFYDSKGELSLSHGQMDSDRTELAYDTLVTVLAEEADDPTRGAVFYKTKSVPQWWGGREAFYLNRKKCELNFTTRVNSHEFFTVVCEK